MSNLGLSDLATISELCEQGAQKEYRVQQAITYQCVDVQASKRPAAPNPSFTSWNSGK